MQFSPRPGDAVTARGARWVVVDVRAYDDCRLVTLCGAAPSCAGVERRLLHPFDGIASIDRPTIPRLVKGARWRAECRAAIAADAPPGSLRHARAARIELMPHQLEPALAVLAGHGSRVLVADEVGLGKTIQAGLILGELLGRGWIERVLVLAPAGLRDQWIHELETRFGIEAAGVDGRRLRQLAATLPLGMNPWSAVPIVVASTDYVKRAEVLPAVAACRWDAVVVDEAHGAAGDSDRRAAVEALASRASYAVLLTATPHSGDRASFASLCALGSVGEDALLVFRRRRADVRAGQLRRVTTIRVRPSADERAMYAALDRYASAVRAERGSDSCLALSVLHKRAFSSPWSLAQSIARRLTAIELDVAEPDAEQLLLPLGDPDGEQTPDDLPPDWPADVGLRDPISDRRWLAALLDACRAASGAERKVAVLRRLLRRTNEKAIVFTEYRDTLRHVQHTLEGVVPVVILHGGMTRDERSAALDEFDRRRRSVLLATDAAGEGLNLQRGCRLVVNLELPWNPMRLEQRIGRVDRIGQTGTVHAIHLVAEATGEMRILERLRARVAQARADIGASNPVGDVRDSRVEADHIARLVVAGEGHEEPAASPDTAPTTPVAHLATPDFRAAAIYEATRLEQARAIVSRIGRDPEFPVVSSWTHAPLVVRSSRAGFQAILATKSLLVWRLSWDDGAGRAMESHLLAVVVEGVPRPATPFAARRRVQELAEHLAPTIEGLSVKWREASAAAIRAFVDARLARERAILLQIGDTPDERFQPGLFDRRADRLHRLLRDEAADLTRRLSARLAFVERMSAAHARPPSLLLAVLP
jgi:superfamily II DNA or RNA helicase